jgi:hypothetical protein
MQLVLSASGIKSRKWRTVSVGVPSSAELMQALKRSPIVFVADNIAQEGSKYQTHHAVGVLEYDEDTGELIIADCDETVPEKEILRREEIAAFLKKARAAMRKIYTSEGDYDEMVAPVARQPVEGSPTCVLF